jgi:hypothetical protein
MKISKEKWNSEQAIASQFLTSDLAFAIGKQTCVGSSEVKKEGVNKGKTLLRFAHASGVTISMGLGDYRVACEKAGVSGIDEEGNIIDQNSEKQAGGQYTIVS